VLESLAVVDIHGRDKLRRDSSRCVLKRPYKRSFRCNVIQRLNSNRNRINAEIATQHRLKLSFDNIMSVYVAKRTVVCEMTPSDLAQPTECRHTRTRSCLFIYASPMHRCAFRLHRHGVQITFAKPISNAAEYTFDIDVMFKQCWYFTCTCINTHLHSRSRKGKKNMFV